MKPENEKKYLPEILHKTVILKNGIEGRVIGFFQENADTPAQYSIETWGDSGKNTEWYLLEDFAVRTITRNEVKQ